MAKPESPALDAFVKFSKANNSLTAALSRMVCLPALLQGSGFPILEALLHKGPLSQREISQKILRTTGNISQALDKLEKAGLIVRTPGPDRRTHAICLTSEGKKAAEEAFRGMSEAITRLFSVLEPSELATFSNLVKKLGLSWSGQA